MKARLLYHMARADFLERARRYSFLATVAGAIYFGYLINAGDVNLTIQGQRGILNSAWVGTLTALAAGLLMPLLGFYLVKDTIERDRKTRVGEILAATPLGKVAYTCGKALSNFLFLGVIVAILGAAGLLLQMLSGEDRHLDLGAFLAPLLWLALPPVAVVAALAVLFESVRWLRGSLGNVVYFFLWTGLIAAAIESPTLDPIGWHLVQTSLHQKVTTLAPLIPGQQEESSFNIGPHMEIKKTFRWSGIDWTARAIAQRLVVAALAVGVALLAAHFFSRFDPAKEGGRPPKPKPEEAEAEAGAAGGKRRRRIALPAWSPANPFLALVVAELRLMLQGRNRWWYLVAAGLLVAGLVAPMAAIRAGILPVAWLWPLALWSGMGAREKIFGTRELVFSGPRPAAYGAAAIWTAGVLVAAGTTAGVALRLLATGQGAGLLAWLAGCLFIPGLAFALGAVSGSSRLFEVVYLLLWYIGPMNHVPAFDYMGVTPQALAQGMPWVYLALAAVLLAAGVGARARQMRG
jgi:hypothetical protein